MKKRAWGFLIFCMLLFCSMPAQKAEAAQKYPYYITVNLTENIVTVYEQDAAGGDMAPKKAFLCSGGRGTPEGTFRTTDKYTWRPLFGDVYGQYATRITGHILFHSVPYLEQDKSTLEYEEYNKLGETVSAGCIRLTAADAKWIYDNCAIGTTVKMYRGEGKEPLQPEKPQRIDPNDALRRGWDPTDPDSANPWNHGELRSMTLQTKQSARKITSYYEKGNYFLEAKDVKQLFAHLGVTLVLPETAGKAADDNVTIWYQAAQHRLPRYEEGGKAYYKLRDLADLTGAAVLWDKQERKIRVQYGKEEVLLFRTVF